jgi:hypothetical protein
MKKYLIILILLCASPVLGEILYVADESDGEYGLEDGSDCDNAFDGFADVVWGSGAGQVEAGDTLQFCSNITDEYFNIGASGSEGSPITIDLYGYTIDTNQSHAVRIEGKSYITLTSSNGNGVVTGGSSTGIKVITTASPNLIIENLNITANLDGIRIDAAAGSNNLILRDCDIYSNTNSGAFIGGSTGVVVDRTVFRLNGQTGQNHDGLFIGNTSTFTVSDSECYSHNGGGACFDFSDSSGTIQRCKVYSHDESVAIGISDSNNDDIVTVYSCLFYNNNAGVRVYEDGDANIYNNTFSGTHTLYLLGVDTDDAGTRTVNFKNNILDGTFAHAYWQRESTTTLIAEYNGIYGGTTAIGKIDGVNKNWPDWTTAGYDDTGSFNSDPLLTATYHLQPGSPAIDTGIDVGITLDLDQVPTGQNGFDMGCYEFDTATIRAITISQLIR